MSTPPGWYQGPDGRWYQQQPPYPPPGYPGGQPPPTRRYGPAGPPPPPPRSNTGKIVAIVLVVFVVLVAGGIFAVYRFVAGVSDRVVGDSGAGCSVVSTADVDSALGGRYEVFQLDGAIGAIAAPVLDTRVLADPTTTCWATEAGSAQTAGRLARIATYTGPDAAARFAAERQQAGGATEDRGNGLTVSTPGYFNKEVDAGDEAFCTTGDMPLASAGALVRRGDTLVYVSTNAAGGGAAAIPDIRLEPGGGPTDALRFGTDDANCDLAVRLAAKVG